MPGEVSEGFLTKLTDRRARVYEAAERLLIEARRQGRQILNEGEDRRYRQARADLTALDEQIAEYRADLERGGIPAHLSRLSLNPPFEDHIPRPTTPAGPDPRPESNNPR